MMLGDMLPLFIPMLMKHSMITKGIVLLEAYALVGLIGETVFLCVVRVL